MARICNLAPTLHGAKLVMKQTPVSPKYGNGTNHVTIVFQCLNGKTIF